MTVTEFGEHTMASIQAKEINHVYEDCRVYWGSHACVRPRYHYGFCYCDCAFDGGEGNVGLYPYYGPNTKFYGEDVESQGFPGMLM